VMCLVAVGMACGHPGGYTGIGGVYKNLRLHPEAMSAAKKASNMALALELENDESLFQGAASRGERNTQVYVPSFFTNEPQPAQPEVQGFARPQRDLQNPQLHALPIYRNAYRPKDASIYNTY